MSQRAARLACIALAAALAALLAGCGGGGGGDHDTTPTPTGTAAITGVVVDASNTSSPVPSAVVRVAATGASATTGSDGTFHFTDLPAGITSLSVDPGPGSAFLASSLDVPTANGQTTSVAVTMIPLGYGVPTRLTVQPPTATVDPGGQQTFTALVYADSTQLAIQPSWVVEGGIGTISSSGTFTGVTQGTGAVIATAGGITGQATVTVTAPQPPKIWSTYIDPSELPTSGGTAFMTVHASDGDGISLVQVQIVKPDTTSETYTMYRTAGNGKDGTWLFPDPPYTPSFVFPANSNLPDSTGTQAPEDYDVRFIVHDSTGAETMSNYMQVRVLGVEPPPPPPG